jgi:hypothetical protein
MRRFRLNRSEDVSGVSGTGIIAEGVVASDGVTVLFWLGDKHTMEIAPTLDMLMSIHGHGGKTVVEFLD